MCSVGCVLQKAKLFAKYLYIILVSCNLSYVPLSMPWHCLWHVHMNTCRGRVLQSKQIRRCHWTHHSINERLSYFHNTWIAVFKIFDAHMITSCQSEHRWACVNACMATPERYSRYSVYFNAQVVNPKLNGVSNILQWSFVFNLLPVCRHRSSHCLCLLQILNNKVITIVQRHDCSIAFYRVVELLSDGYLRLIGLYGGLSR